MTIKTEVLTKQMLNVHVKCANLLWYCAYTNIITREVKSDKIPNIFGGYLRSKSKNK